MIGQDIQQIRLVNKLSQEALGNPQFSAAYISRVENGLQEPSRRFLSHVATRLPYRDEQFYQPGCGGHLIDTLMRMALVLEEMEKRELALSLAEQGVEIAHQSGDPLVICWAMGFQLMLYPHVDPLTAKRFWQMVQIVDWNRANAEAMVRFVKVLGKLSPHIQGEGISSAKSRKHETFTSMSHSLRLQHPEACL